MTNCPHPHLSNWPDAAIIKTGMLALPCVFVMGLSLIVDKCRQNDRKWWGNTMAERQRQATKAANEDPQTKPLEQERLAADRRDDGALVAQQQALLILSALGQETRLKAFRLLSVAGDEGIGAGGLARHLGTPHNTLSTHLAILSRAGLIASERSGRNITYRIVPESLSNLLLFLLDDCCNAMPEACMPKSLLERLRAGADQTT